MKKKIIRLTSISLGIILILVAGYWLYLEYQTDIQLLLNPRVSKAELFAHTRSYGTFTSILLTVLIAVMCAVSGIPISIVGVIAGLSFRPLTGAVINILGNALGNIIATSLMHRLRFLDKKTGTSHWVQATRQTKHPKVGVMLGYMISVIPSSMANFAADAMKLPLQQIILSIVIGVVPSSVLYVCGEEALFRGYNKTVVTLVASVTMLVGLVVSIYRDRKKRQGK